MKNAYLLLSASALILGAALYSSQNSSQAQPQTDAARCVALAGKKVGPDTVIESAQWRPDGDTVGGTRVTTPFCRAIGVATPTSDSRIGFEVWLPLSAWNGKFVGEFEAAKLPQIELISKMMGKEVSEADFQRTSRERKQTSGAPLLRLSKVGRKRALNPIDLEIYPGEILGLSGLLGSGRTETARLVFGVDHPDSGEMTLDSTPVKIRSAKQAMEQKFGFCPEDRKV